MQSAIAENKPPLGVSEEQQLVAALEQVYALQAVYALLRMVAQHRRESRNLTLVGGCNHEIESNPKRPDGKRIFKPPNEDCIVMIHTQRDPPLPERPLCPMKENPC